MVGQVVLKRACGISIQITSSSFETWQLVSEKNKTKKQNKDKTNKKQKQILPLNLCIINCTINMIKIPILNEPCKYWIFGIFYLALKISMTREIKIDDTIHCMTCIVIICIYFLLWNWNRYKPYLFVYKAIILITLIKWYVCNIKWSIILYKIKSNVYNYCCIMYYKIYIPVVLLNLKGVLFLKFHNIVSICVYVYCCCTGVV